MRIIGLTGHPTSRTGKDTVAEYLERYHGFQRVSFADAMRCMVYALAYEYGLSLPPDREEEIDGLDTTERALLQEVGAALRRCDPSMVIKLADRKLGKDTVISDIRTEEEAAWIRWRGGEIWHIYRSNTPEVRDNPIEAGINNPGELSLVNDGTFAELYDEIDEILEAEDEEIYGLSDETKARMEYATPKDYVGEEVQG